MIGRVLFFFTTGLDFTRFLVSVGVLDVLIVVFFVIRMTTFSNVAGSVVGVTVLPLIALLIISPLELIQNITDLINILSLTFSVSLVTSLVAMSYFPILKRSKFFLKISAFVGGLEHQ